MTTQSLTTSSSVVTSISQDTALLSVVLKLLPLRVPPNPKPMARAVHAVMLQAIKHYDPYLAETIHNTSSVKPFTASDVFMWQEHYMIRLTATTRSVAQALERALRSDGILAPRARLDLAGAQFEVAAAATRPEAHPWAGQTAYSNLAMPWLYRHYAPTSRLTLEFASPVTFKSNEMNVPVPMPVWVFGSLSEKWNAFAPTPLPESLREFAATQVALSRYDLRTVAMPFKDGAMKFGAVGVATYTAPRSDSALWYALHLLADFAFYAGVGAGTTMGLGQCRKMNNEE